MFLCISTFWYAAIKPIFVDIWRFEIQYDFERIFVKILKTTQIVQFNQNESKLLLNGGKQEDSLKIQ